MKLIVLFFFLIIGRLQCRSANDFLKDVFSIEEDPKEQKCSTMQCRTAGKFTKILLIIYLIHNIILLV